MSQQDTSKKSARAARAQRNRPTLVTSSDPVNVDTEVLESSETEVHTEGLGANQDEAPAKRRFPGFFSSVGKSAEGEAKQEEGTVTQARMARAARTKVAAQVQSAKEPEKPKAQAKPAAKPAATQARSAAPARPASPFKTRYIIGIAIYLIASNFLGMAEMYVLKTMNWERLLTTLDLFGAKIPISVSTLAFLATLIIILVVLARLDLIPRTLGTAQPKTGTTASRKSEPQRSSDSAPKAAPPAVKQGVKGDHDHLYQEYQTQRRKKK